MKVKWWGLVAQTHNISVKLVRVCRDTRKISLKTGERFSTKSFSELLGFWTLSIVGYYRN
jgi:hypothetical protein